MTVIVTESVSFSCTFEKDTESSCLLTDDYESTNEIWDIVDGRGLVADNTLNSGTQMIVIYMLNITEVCTAVYFTYYFSVIITFSIFAVNFGQLPHSVWMEKFHTCINNVSEFVDCKS